MENNQDMRAEEADTVKNCQYQFKFLNCLPEMLITIINVAINVFSN